MSKLCNTVRTLQDFISERETIRLRKDSGLSKPWTDDPILQRYFISNIDCEDDKTTRWLKANWRDPHENDPDLWFAISVFRRSLNIPTELPYPVPWMPSRFGKHFRCNPHAYRLVVGHKRGSGGFHSNQAENLVYYVFNPLWQRREEFRPVQDETHESYFNRLSKAAWMGGWYSYRVICDLKHTKWLRNSPDWWTWCLLGPGTLRGLNRLVGRPVDEGMIHKDGVLITLSKKERARRIEEINRLRGTLSAQVFGGALCEWDKYERIRLGEGKVRLYA